MAGETTSGFWDDIRAFSEDVSPFDFMTVLDHWDLFAWGMANTIILVVLSMLFGGMLAVPMAIARANRTPVVNEICYGFIYLFRGTPLLVQTYLIYYGLPQFDFVRDSMLWPFLREAWYCALLAFVLNTAAYTAEMLRGAIEATPFGEVEAAKAAGMSRYKAYRRIILPSAFRRALPAYSNEVIFLLHGTVVAGVITVQELFGAGEQLNSRYYLAYEGYITVAILYGIMVWIMAIGFRWWERKWHAHLRPRTSVETT